MADHHICFNCVGNMNAFKEMNQIEGEQSRYPRVNDFDGICEVLFPLKDDIFFEVESFRHYFHIVVFKDLNLGRLFSHIISK